MKGTEASAALQLYPFHFKIQNFAIQDRGGYAGGGPSYRGGRGDSGGGYNNYNSLPRGGYSAGDRDDRQVRLRSLVSLIGG